MLGLGLRLGLELWLGLELGLGLGLGFKNVLTLKIPPLVTSLLRLIAPPKSAPNGPSYTTDAVLQ